MQTRLRRLRLTPSIRDMVRENSISVSDLIYPLFVVEGRNIKKNIDSLPDIYQYSLDLIDEELDRMNALGVNAVLLFGIPKNKDAKGSEAYNPHGVVAQAIRHIKLRYPKIVVIADVCLCEYTDHGHCGLVCDCKILNDETLPLLAKMSVALAQAGADIIAPSDMMDGRVGYIRKALDDANLKDVLIMSYSAKFSSSYYAPFREAANSAPTFGDRKTYQMDPANGNEAIREILEDISEGADMVMVKPALAYLDVLKEASQITRLPLVTYNVSGEYAMVKAAAKLGYIDEKKIVLENMIAMKRAGAKLIITYHALDVAKWLLE
ncbi:MAG: porphobilinogen synthase [Succinivibrionaceae bacterium]